ncbi:hypothetical protein AVEN_220028-1 [Araneus ventricosus]|uniref:Uncharacterized protein n=1 Tax=Araneus ventricosus TaxID=182803 RepID=A0A4Y2CRN9_ARAVE|nr:hypothetical protein AVEN_220028-1 [Araneus ventricosus]
MGKCPKVYHSGEDAMDPAGKAGRLNSRIRRQRSHEWKDYGSSSENDDDLETYRYDESSRNSQDIRKGDSGNIIFYKSFESTEKFPITR